MKNGLGDVFSESDIAETYPTLQIGSSGEAVGYLQLVLNVVIGTSLNNSGKFDENTQAAVIRFQTLNNLIADGIVSGKTWNTLLALYDKQTKPGKVKVFGLDSTDNDLPTSALVEKYKTPDPNAKQVTAGEMIVQYVRENPFIVIGSIVGFVLVMRWWEKRR